MYRVLVILLLPFVVHTIDGDHEPADAFQKDCLDAHNTYRAEHGVPPLAWSAELTRQAQKWADVLASKDELKHDDEQLTKNNEGENLAYFRPAVPKCQDSMVGNCILCREMVKRWYDEVKFYDFDNGAGLTPEAVTKHFTQIIWSNTSEVGIGTAISKKYGFITVARYWPQGNKGGPEMYILNVPPEGGPLPSLPSNDTPTKAAVGIPEAISPKQPPNGAAKIDPKAAKVKQDVNDTQLADLASQDPHQQAQNDDIGNTFDSHMNKDFGYEGQKMYGDSHKGDIEYKIQVDSPQGKDFNPVHGHKAYDSTKSGGQSNQSIKKQDNSDIKGNSDAGKSDDVVYGSNMENEGSLEDYNTDNNNRNDLSNGYSAENKENNGDATENNKNINKNNGDAMGNNENNRNDGNGKENNNDLNNMKNGYPMEDNGYFKNDGYTSEDREYKGYNFMENNRENNENNGEHNFAMEDKQNSGFIEDNKQQNNDEINNLFNINRVKSRNFVGALLDNIAGSRNRHLTNSQNIRETLQNKGLVRTVKGPDGSSAQVYLTKNGDHAGLVFRNHISRASSLEREKAKEPKTNRVIYVV